MGKGATPLGSHDPGFTLEKKFALKTTEAQEAAKFQWLQPTVDGHFIQAVAADAGLGGLVSCVCAGCRIDASDEQEQGEYQCVQGFHNSV